MVQNDPSGNDHKISQWEAMEFVWELLIAVAVPTTLFALLGRWLDNRFDLSPWMTLLGLFLALASSSALIVRKGVRMAERMKSSKPSKPPEHP